MKLLYVAKNIPIPGNDENDIIIRLAKLMESKGHKVDLIYPREKYAHFLKILYRLSLGKDNKRLVALTKLLSSSLNSFNVMGRSISFISYFRIPFIKPLEWIFAHFLIKPTKYVGYDLVHSHFIFPDGIVGAKIAKKNNLNLIVTVREGDLKNIRNSQVNRSIAQSVLEQCDAIIALTPRIKKELTEMFGLEINVIGNFVKDEYFTTEDNLQVNKNKNKNKDKFRLILVANFIARKNIDWALEYANMHRNKVDLVVCGDGELFDLYHEKYNDIVTFTGKVCSAELIKYLDYSDVFVLPSDNESFGISYIEAACRKNIIIGKSGTGLDGIDSEGFYFCSNKQNFFDIIDNLVNLDEMSLEIRKSRAREKANSFSETSIYDMINDTYIRAQG